MTVFSKRLKEAMQIRGINQTELCSLTGIPKSAMSQYLSGTFKPKQQRTYLIAKALNVNEAWLMGYDDISMETIEKPTEPLTELTAKFDNIRPVQLKRFPMLGEIACGEPIWADEDHESHIMADMDIQADFCLRAKGDSMINARIYDGDIVFIKEMPIVENGDIAAVIIDNEATLKRFYYDKENNYLQLIAENPLYKPLVYRNEQLDEIRVLGKAVYFMSAL
ncbi:MAG: helix-turn-helix domain-containing protein [Ruminococcus sp.]|nr:helix-turn-helix domain-containing protein [Ruminococcus sp.]